MKKLPFLFFICCLKASHAYEIETHAMLTYQAYLQSNLKADPTLLQNLGIDYYNPNNPFGNNYTEWDNTMTTLRSNVTTHEDTIILTHLWNENDPTRKPPDPRPQRPEALSSSISLPGWLMRGAVREDDGAYVYPDRWPAWSGIWLGPKTQPRGKGIDGQFDKIARFCNHFFDPTKPPLQQQFTGGCPGYPTVVSNSLDWALGIKNAFASPAEEDPKRLNRFSLINAKEALYRAVTGIYIVNGTPTYLTPAARKYHWTTLFYSLGGIMHLIEDTSQPQHTRNEGHAGVGLIDTEKNDNGWKGNPVYEAYTNARVLGKPDFFRKRT